MTKETFMLVSLKEDKAKKLAQVISNPTCRKILDFLANKESTESEIAKALDIPLSTVHYNLVQLKESKLVEVEEFHYSSKGKEVDHYKLANKFIIIAPKESSYSSDLMDKLKTLLPVVTIFGAGVALWQYFVLKSEQVNMLADSAVSPMMAAVPSSEAVGGAQPMMAKMAAPVAAPMAIEAAQDAQVATMQSADVVVKTSFVAWQYFVVGAIVAILLYILVDLIRKKFFKKDDFK